MTIEAGFSGQPFLPETLDKVRTIKEMAQDLPVEVDGGIDDKTARLAIEAGANRLVSTSYLLKHPERIDAAIKRLKRFEGSAGLAFEG
jgi:ribulose-phosphate 3-epimerase